MKKEVQANPLNPTPFGYGPEFDNTMAQLT